MIPVVPFLRVRHTLAALLLLGCPCTQAAFSMQAASSHGQTISPSPEGTPVSWIQAAADNELRIIEQDGEFPVRYLVHKIDDRGDTTRDTIESRDGAVARLIERNGKPITAEEDAAERRRLEDLLNSPPDFLRKHKRNSSAREYTSTLVRQMPKAMIYTYVPGQPQLAGVASPQIVIDFKPDPNFKPSGMVADLLTGIEGRLWIDAHTRTLLRSEARVSQAVDFGWGMLAHIYPGGTVEFEQTSIGNGHWIYSHAVEHLRIREVLIKVAVANSVMTTSSVKLLPEALTYQEAIHKLLDTPLPVAP